MEDNMGAGILGGQSLPGTTEKQPHVCSKVYLKKIEFPRQANSLLQPSHYENEYDLRTL